MKQKKIFIIYASTLSIIVTLFGGFYIYKTIVESREVGKTTFKEDDYYSIRNNATQLQKSLYKDLIKSVEEDPRNEKEMYELLAKNYIADFYTWTNKFRRNDVGGVQFVLEDIRANVFHQAQQKTYNDLYYYLENDGLEDTLEVSDIKTKSSKAIEFFIHNKDGEDELIDEVEDTVIKGDYVKAYEVKLTWDYKESSFRTSDYDQEATIIMMLNEDNIPMIIEVSHDEELDE